MPVIRISNELYAKLESLANGFDTPQNVIERLIAKTEGTNMKQEEPQQGTEITRRSKRTTSGITLDVIKQIYPLAKDVFEQRADIYDAHNTLVEDVGMNEATAMIYLQIFQNMMKGECYKRSINGATTEYFLEMILADYGQEAFKTALSSVDKYIKNYESHGWGEKRNIRNIHNKFSKLV